MTARCLLPGVVHRITHRTSAAANAYLMVCVREGNGDAVRWRTIFTFRDNVFKEVERLSIGAAIAFSGTFEAKLYAPNGGDSRVCLTMITDATVSARAVEVAGFLGEAKPEPWSVGRGGILRRELMKAEREGSDQLALFASQHFNVEIGVGLQSDYWPGARHWEKNGDPDLTLEAILARADIVTVGIDGRGLDDLLRLAVISRDAETRRWLHWGHAGIAGRARQPQIGLSHVR